MEDKHFWHARLFFSLILFAHTRTRLHTQKKHNQFFARLCGFLAAPKHFFAGVCSSGAGAEFQKQQQQHLGAAATAAARLCAPLSLSPFFPLECKFGPFGFLQRGWQAKEELRAAAAGKRGA
jgi:hypothetical protein